MILGIIQARMNSFRLPGKVLMPLGERTMLGHVVARARAIRSLDGLTVATCFGGGGLIAAHCETLGVPCFLWDGPEQDVLGRFVGCMDVHAGSESDLIVRICADAPLLDSQAADALVVAAVESRADYAGYQLAGKIPAAQKPTGYFAEVARRGALRRANAELAADDPRREHVTQYLYETPDRFRCHWLNPPTWYKTEKMKYAAVDTPEDLERIRRVLANGD